jgi:hypothetical protein
MMDIQFDRNVEWTPALEGVAIWMTVDGKRVGCVMEGRVLAKHFGVKNKPITMEGTFWRNRDFLEGIIRDAIARGMVKTVHGRNQLLLGEEELRPYLEKAAGTATAPA